MTLGDTQATVTLGGVGLGLGLGLGLELGLVLGLGLLYYIWSKAFKIVK